MIRGPRGRKGNAGAPGAAGASGLSAYCSIPLTYTQPSVGSTIDVRPSPTGAGSWATVGQIVYLTAGGYYEVMTPNAPGQITIKNLGYTGNAAPGATVGAGQLSPGGATGATGSTLRAGPSDSASDQTFTIVAKTTVKDLTFTPAGTKVRVCVTGNSGFGNNISAEWYCEVVGVSGSDQVFDGHGHTAAPRGGFAMSYVVTGLTAGTAYTLRVSVKPSGSSVTLLCATQPTDQKLRMSVEDIN